MTEASPTSTAMPIWITDSRIDPSWIEENMPGDFPSVSGCTAEDISNDGRRGNNPRNGSTLLLRVTRRDDGIETNTATKIKTLVAKQIPPSGLALSQRLGLAREAMFYNQLAPRIKFPVRCCTPKIYCSSGSMDDGSKIIVMEDLSGGFVDSGILFGPGNPNNWSRDLWAAIAGAYPTLSRVPTPFEVANQSFVAMASVHAAFWRDSALLGHEYSWLRGSSWTSGSDEASWRASQGVVQASWARYTASEIENDNDGGSNNDEQRIQWDPLVREILETAMKGISWESQRQRLNAGSNFCLVHGDFWPGNVMISKDQGPATSVIENDGRKGCRLRQLRLLDWEMVGE
ncbi:unnamed protein product [Pseudo-nitzschia multistriata]|uniref:Aminoglycoside phosphotransferase domain-containing protein n=1 Tax=Pseudo-nitzschia multistriata TaxID=183589 RepID=A0A448ZQ54_9STRA|nr:unnamed protein product [Pseudo-nitzschia multistriata]